MRRPDPQQPTLTDLVVAVTGDDEDTLMLPEAERAAARLRYAGLRFDDHEGDDMILPAIEALTEKIFGFREERLSALKDAGVIVDGQRTVRVFEITHGLLRAQSVCAYNLGLAMGWHAAQRFGGAR